MAKKTKAQQVKELGITREELRMSQERTDALKIELGLKVKINEEGKTQLNLTKQVSAQALDFIGKQEDGARTTKDIQKDYNKAKALQAKLDASIEKTGGNTSKIVKDSKDIQDEIVGKKLEELNTSIAIDKSLGLAGKSVSVMNKLLGGTLGDTSKILENAREEVKARGGSINKLTGFKAVVGQTGKSIAKNLNDPMTYLLLLLENSTAVTKFQNELGVSYGSAIGLRDEMSQIANNSGDVFINSKKIQESFFNMSTSLGFVADFSGQTLETMTNLEKRLGLATNEAAEMTMLFKLQGNNTEEIASNTFDTLTNTIKLGNVAVTPKQVFEEIAKTSKSIQVSLGANPEAIGKAIIAAKQLGASLSQIDQIASSTLDFESSISNELEAELLTGKQLNLERARLLALNNDFAGVAKEIAKQGIDFASFSTMNRIQQEATAKALGLSRDTLSEMTLQQQMQTMSSEEIKNNFGEGAYEQAKALDATQKFASAVEKIKGLFSDVMVILTPIIDGVALLADLVGKVVSVFGNFTPMLAAALPIMKGLNMAARLHGTLTLKTAIAGIFRSFSRIPFGIGIPLALGAVGGLYSMFNKADDVGYGNNMLVTKNKGAIMLNNNDSVVAGTNLLGGESGGGEAIDYDKMASAMSKAQVNVSTKYDSFSSNSTTSNGGKYQSTARYESKFV